MMRSEIGAVEIIDKDKTSKTVYYIMDMFDWKTESKVIRLFVSGEEDKKLIYTWIGIPSKVYSGRSTLFLNKSGSVIRKEVEE